MSKKKKAETPGAKLKRFQRLCQQATAKPRKIMDQAIELFRKRQDKVDADVGRVLESTLKTGFLDYQISSNDELVIELSPRNRDPLDQAPKLLRLTGFKRICFIVTHDVREVQ